MMVCGYNLKEGERVVLEFTPAGQCPANEIYVIRTMSRLEVRGAEGELVKSFIKR